MGSVLAKHQWTNEYNSVRSLLMKKKKNSLPHKKLIRLKLQHNPLQLRVHNLNKPLQMGSHLHSEQLSQMLPMMCMLLNSTLEMRKRRSLSLKLINLAKLLNLNVKRSNCRIVLKS